MEENRVHTHTIIVPLFLSSEVHSRGTAQRDLICMHAPVYCCFWAVALTGSRARLAAALARVNQEIIHVERDRARVAANRRQLHRHDVRRRLRLRLILRLLQRLMPRQELILILRLRQRQRLRMMPRNGRLGRGSISDEAQIRVDLQTRRNRKIQDRDESTWYKWSNGRDFRIANFRQQESSVGSGWGFSYRIRGKVRR